MQMPLETHARTELRSLTKSDVDAVREIAKDGFGPVWSPSEFELFIGHRAGHNLGTFVEERLVSYLLSLRSASECDVVAIATSPTERRCGFGRSLIESLQKDAALTVISLEVGVQNEGAIGFYKAMGFEIVGLRKKYYQGREDAILMRWERGLTVKA